MAFMKGGVEHGALPSDHDRRQNTTKRIKEGSELAMVRGAGRV